MASREQFPERNAQIISKRKAGIGPREIARQIGVSRNVVASLLHRKGLTDPTSYNAHFTPRPSRKGEAHNAAKITYAIADEIRQLLNTGASGRRLSKTFGISESVISRIKSGRTWAHVEQAT